MADLKIVSLSKKYPGGVVALDHIDLEIPSGECVAIFGLDRSGKSTLLRILAGLEPATDGNIKLGERDITESSVRDRNFAFVFRDSNLDNKDTVFDNLAYGLRARKVPEEAIDVKVKAVAEILGLSNCLQRKPKTLTPTERRRILLGRAICRDPEVYLFDDPFSGYDAEQKNSVLSDLVLAQARLGATFIFATDDMRQAMTLADRIVILREGKIVRVDTPAALVENPGDDFIAAVTDVRA